MQSATLISRLESLTRARRTPGPPRQTRPDEWGIDAPVPVATRHSASMASLQPVHYPGLHTRRKRRSIAVLPEYSCRLSYGLIYARGRYMT